MKLNVWNNAATRFEPCSDDLSNDPFMLSGLQVVFANNCDTYLCKPDQLVDCLTAIGRIVFGNGPWPEAFADVMDGSQTT